MKRPPGRRITCWHIWRRGGYGVYAPRRQSLWIMQQLPQAEEQRIETQLRELHRTGRRTAVVEVQLRRDEETFRVRVLCVRA